MYALTIGSEAVRYIYGKETRYVVLYTPSPIRKLRFMSERREQKTARFTAKEGLFIMAAYTAVSVVFIGVDSL
jgi:hypothetical protein